MIDKENFVSFNFLKKENYTGSMQGMRYQLSKEEENEVFKLRTTIWPEPYSFQVTKEEKKQSHDFEFSKDGKDEAVDWLNQQYDQQKEFWDKVNPYK